MWCVAELNLDVERIDAGFTYGLTNTADYLAMNPNGKVPTLCDGRNPPIWESGAILRYLANVYTEDAVDSFWPSDPVSKARVDMWAEWSKLNVAVEFTAPVFWRAVRTPKARRDQTALNAAVVHLEQNMRIADRQLAEFDYLAGNHFTLADIQFGHVLYRYYDIDIDRAADLENIARYYRALEQRQHYRDHVMVSYEELIDSM